MSMTDKKFKARYQVADGYAGGSRPQHFTIHAGDLEDDMDDAALQSFYEQSVQDDFEQKIYPDSERMDEFIAWAKERLAEKGES